MCAVFVCVCGIYMWVVYTQHMCVYKCTACACAYGGQRVYAGCGPLSISLGQLSYLFVLYALLPGVAVQIKMLTSVKVLGRILYVFF